MLENDRPRRGPTGSREDGVAAYEGVVLSVVALFVTVSHG